MMIVRLYFILFLFCNMIVEIVLDKSKIMNLNFYLCVMYDVKSYEVKVKGCIKKG